MTPCATKSKTTPRRGCAASCSKRGRNAELAEKTIREAKPFTEKEALDDHLIDLIAPDQARLFADLDGREITRFDGRKEILHTRGRRNRSDYRTSRERIIRAIADPNVGFHSAGARRARAFMSNSARPA